MESTKLSARVTAYRDAIREARDAGVTWGQLAALFSADAKYFSAVCKAMDTGRYKAVEQLPLPEAQVPGKTSKQHLGKAPSAFTEKRPLPGQQIPVGDAEAIVDAVEEKLGTNFFK